MDDYRGVVDAVQAAQRRAHHQDGQQVRGGLDDVEQRPLDGFEQGVLQQDVLYGITGQGQLGENRQRDALLVTLARQSQY